MYAKRLIFAALLITETPLKIADLVRLNAQFNADSVKKRLKEIALDCEKPDSVLDLVETADGYRLQTQLDLAEDLQNLNAERTVKLPRATLEILAIIAHRQPASRGDIEKIRGVAVATQSLQTLKNAGWIISLGHRDTPGKPEIFGTTPKFLSDLGLKTLDDLPPVLMENDFPR